MYPQGREKEGEAREKEYWSAQSGRGLSLPMTRAVAGALQSLEAASFPPGEGVVGMSSYLPAEVWPLTDSMEWSRSQGLGRQSLDDALWRIPSLFRDSRKQVISPDCSLMI